MRSLVLSVCIFALVCIRAGAQDEQSITELRDALVKLAPDVDAHEAELLSVTVHTMSRELAREYGVTGDPAVHNFLINTGRRKRGYCAHYVRDIGIRIRTMPFKTLVFHWGAAYAKTSDESNCLVVTARNQPFDDGIIMDAWRHGGRLFWCRLKDDREYQVKVGSNLNRLGGRPYSGIPAWKEDLQETAWLQSGPKKVQTRRR